MIVYLHGFNSSGNSHKARMLGDHLQALGLGAHFCAPDLPHRPAQAIAQVNALLARADRQPTLIGSSLGGYYATYLAERHDLRAVLINPAVAPYRLLGSHLGPQQNVHTGERYELTGAHLDELLALDVARLRPERYLLLVQAGDEILDYREAITRYAGARQHVIPGGDHGFQSFERHLEEILAFAGHAEP